MPKKYLVQTMTEDGDVFSTMETIYEITEDFGFRDCTNYDFKLFDVSTFGEVVEIVHVPAVEAPFNYHLFINSKTGEVEYEGYSAEH